jgi:VanZ family protein
MRRIPARPTSRLIDAILWSLSAVSATLTVWLSLLSVPPGTPAFAQADKVQHFVAYLVTSGLLYLAAVWRPGRGDGVFGGAGPILGVAFVAAAGAIELLQAVVGREAEVLDWVAGSVGAAMAYLVLSRLRRLS